MSHEYADAHTTPFPDYVRDLVDDTMATQTATAMLTSPAAARLLELLAWSLQARSVLEIGTYTGHSALAMAAGMAPDARDGIARLAAHLAGGAWHERHGHLLSLDELDLGYRLLVG